MPIVWRRGGPRAALDVCGKSRPPPGFDPRTVQPVASRYTDWLSRPLLSNQFKITTKLPVLFLGALAELRKAIIYLCHICLSVRIEQLGSHWTEFHEMWYSSIIRKSVEKIQVSLKSVKSIVIPSRSVLLERELFQTEAFQRKLKHIFCSVTSSRKSYSLWDNVV
jgi:hypothetical protein